MKKGIKTENKTFKKFTGFISVLLIIATLLTGSMCYTAFALSDIITDALSTGKKETAKREATLKAPEAEKVVLPTVPEEKKHGIISSQANLEQSASRFAPSVEAMI